MPIAGPAQEQSLAVLTFAAGPAADGKLATFPSEYSGPVRDQQLTVFPSEYSGPVREQQLIVAVPVFSGPTEGYANIAPDQTYSGPTGGNRAVTSDRNYGGATEGSASIVAERSYAAPTIGNRAVVAGDAFGAPTEGEASLPPARNFGAATSGIVANIAPVSTFGGPTEGFASGFPGPTNLTATVMDAGCVRLDWDDVTVVPEDNFQIERSLTGTGDWTIIGIVDMDVLTFLDRFAVPLTTYDYRVLATTTAGDVSAPSNIAMAVTPLPPDIAIGPPPVAPVDPPRNQIQPDVITFDSPGIYGLEKDSDGDVTGFKY